MLYDVIVVGGGFAGLSAALTLGRARRSVLVIDAGEPRNRIAEHAHGLLAQDGRNPGSILACAKSQLARYPTVTISSDTAIHACSDGPYISVETEGGDVRVGSRLLLAFGLTDVVPDISGLQERWGRSVLHCPYCHGFEFADKKLGVLNTSSSSEHQALLVSDWGPTTYYLQGGEEPASHTQHEMARRGVRIERSPVQALVSGDAGLSGVKLQDGRLDHLSAMFVLPKQLLNSSIAREIGCSMTDSELGQRINVVEGQMTSVTHVYAAGDITHGAHNITFACADGVAAALSIHHSLIFATR